MPTELYDEDGNAVNAFTEEDVEAKTQEAIADKEATIATLNEQLEKEQEKEKNFAALRAQKGELNEEQQEKEQKAEATIADLQAQIEDAKGAGVNKVIEMQVQSTVDDFADGDEELAAKIIENYNSLNKPDGTAAEIQAKVKDAYLMSMDIGADEVLNAGITPPSGAGEAMGGGGDASVSDDLKGIGRQFGLSDADWKKYNK